MLELKTVEVLLFTANNILSFMMMFMAELCPASIQNNKWRILGWLIIGVNIWEWRRLASICFYTSVMLAVVLRIDIQYKTYLDNVEMDTVYSNRNHIMFFEELWTDSRHRKLIVKLCLSTEDLWYGCLGVQPEFSP